LYYGLHYTGDAERYVGTLAWAHSGDIESTELMPTRVWTAVGFGRVLEGEPEDYDFLCSLQLHFIKPKA